MSIKIMSKVLEYEGLKSGTKLILLALANYSNDDGENIYPSLTTLSKISGLTRPAVISNLKKLIAAGIITKTGERNSGTIMYKINPDALDQDHKQNTASKETLPAEKSNGKVSLPPPVKKLNYPSKESLPDPLINHKRLTSSNDDVMNQKGNQIIKKPNPTFMMALKLSKTCSMDFDLPSNKNRLLRRSKELVQAGYTDTDLDRFLKYWRLNDWRGKQGQSPTPENVISEIAKSIPKNDQTKKVDYNELAKIIS